MLDNTSKGNLAMFIFWEGGGGERKGYQIFNYFTSW